MAAEKAMTSPQEAGEVDHPTTDRDDAAGGIGEELWDAIKGALSRSRDGRGDVGGDGRRDTREGGGGRTVPKEK